MSLYHVRQGYLAGLRRMAVTKPLWHRGPIADIEQGMRMAALMHAYGRRKLPDWPPFCDGWPADVMRAWLVVCLSDGPAIRMALEAA
jgi:hypothetical protein